MREWSLVLGSPLYPILVADARLSAADYVNDHIWELEFGSGEPAALALYTTYGLRARSMRIYPRFTEAGVSISNPGEFADGPRLRCMYPNFLELVFFPFQGLEVIYELRVPDSHTVAGRVTVSNHTTAMRRLQLEMCGGLVPLEGHALTHTQMQMVNVLVGETSGLIPLLFLTGGPHPGPGPQPSLMVDLELGSGASRQLTWVQAATNEHQASFDMARLVAAQPWDAERARIELVNTRDMLEIHTTDPDWDAALAFSQNAAFSLFFPGNENLPQPSFVYSRGPDQGYSRKGDGSDYPASWNGQSPLDAYYLASLLQASPFLAQGLLRNYLVLQTEDGTIDGKPGLGGQRGRYQAMPILASLTWALYHAGEDESLLAEAFPKLLNFFWAWFSPQNDRDHDGIPEWSYPLQTGYEENPLFDTWNPGSQGADIASVYHPGLISLLYREAQLLIRMAEMLGKQPETRLVAKQAEKLKSTLDAAWDSRAALYRYRDRATGASVPGKVLARQRGSGTIKLKKEFEPPIRLLIEVQSKNLGAKRPQVIIGELVTKGESEVIHGSQFQWCSSGLVVTSRQVHAKIGRIDIRGVDAKDKVVVHSLNYMGEDQTLLLPLWAGVPDLQRARAMLSRVVLNAERFDRPFGLSACPRPTDPASALILSSVYLPWNQLICEGLLAYGFRQEAARLVMHMMAGVLRSLKQTNSFSQRYHAETGQGMGERNALSGLAPVGLFLQVLGVQVVSPTRVRLQGKNPFAWPVTVQYRGLKIIRGLDQTEVIFPNGKSMVVDDPEPCVVSL